MAHMIDVQQNEQSNTLDANKKNSSVMKCFLKWRGQSEESLKQQNVILRKTYYSHILFSCFNLDSNWYSCLGEMGFPVKTGRNNLEDCLTCDDLDCMILIEDIFSIILRLSKSNVYLQKLLVAMEKIEMNLINNKSADFLLEKVNHLLIVQQTWSEVFLQFEAAKSRKILILFLMKLYEQRVNAFDASVDSWEEMKKMTILDTYVGDSLCSKGEEQLKKSNLREALGFFNEAIFNCPLDSNNYKKRATIHASLNNHKLCSSDLIRALVLEPQWEAGYVLLYGILMNMDKVWTEYCLKLIDKWEVGDSCSYTIQTARKDMLSDGLTKKNGFGSPDVKMKEVKSPLSKNDQLVCTATNLYKQQKYKEVLQKFKPSILETTFYQIALLSLIHLKRLDEARQLALTATDTFTDMRQFSGDENEAKNLKKMFEFVKSLPCTPFADCHVCKIDLQSTSIYLYNDLSVLDDLFHQGCVVLLCEKRCKIAFHFECLSGCSSFVWTESCLENYIGSMCQTPECQSHIVSAEAFFVDNTKPIKVPECSDTSEGAQNLNDLNCVNSSSEESILVSNLLENPVAYMALPDSPSAQTSTLNYQQDAKPLPSYKEYERKKPGKKKKRRSRNMCPVPDRVDDNCNQEFTETLQYEDQATNGSVSSQFSDTEKENLLLYLLSVLHEHGPQSENGEIFQTEMKALKEDQKKIIDENGGLAFFLCQSNNVLLKDPDILYLNPDTMTTVIPDSESFPLQTYQTSAGTESLALNANPCASISFSPEENTSFNSNSREEFEALNPNIPLKEPNEASGYTNEYSSNPAGGFPKKGFVDEGLKRRNLRPDKREVTNILDEIFSDSNSGSCSSTRSSSSSSNSSSYSQLSERGKESEEDDDDAFFRFSGDESVNSTSTDSDFRTCEMCAKFKRRLVTLEQSYKNTLLQYSNERRKVELAEVEISILKSQVTMMRKEIRSLKGKNDDISSSEGMEASNLCSGKKKKSYKKEKCLAPLETDNLCVICHEHLLKRGANTNLQCGHTFHDYCIRKWFEEQATCPTCRKHTLLVEEFPPLFS